MRTHRTTRRRFVAGLNLAGLPVEGERIMGIGLSGRVAIVTGAAQGLGLATAEALAASYVSGAPLEVTGAR
jgi:hypothetical protein